MTDAKQDSSDAQAASVVEVSHQPIETSDCADPKKTMPPSRPLDRAYLTKFHEDATAQLKVLEIKLIHEVNTHRQSHVTIHNLQVQLAGHQGALARMMIYLDLEQRRGDMYKRLYNDRLLVEGRGMEHQQQCHQPSSETFVDRKAE